jgi:hypothetical protein
MERSRQWRRAYDGEEARGQMARSEEKQWGAGKMMQGSMGVLTEPFIGS